MEQSISAVLKPSLRRVVISKFKPGDCSDNYEYWLSKYCTGGTRVPPPLPERVAHLLKHEKSFYAKSDVEVVASLYASCFEAVAPAQQRLEERLRGARKLRVGLAPMVRQAQGSIRDSRPKCRVKSHDARRTADPVGRSNAGGAVVPRVERACMGPRRFF